MNIRLPIRGVSHTPENIRPAHSGRIHQVKKNFLQKLRACLNTGPECFSCRKTNKEEQREIRITVQKTTNTVQLAAIVPYISF